VVALFALVQFASPQGSLLVALLLVVGAGVLPLAMVLYVMGAPGRRRRRLAAEAAVSAARPSVGTDAPPRGAANGVSVGARLWADPDGSGHAAGDTVAPKREEA
jgi:hypothetical protein